LPILRRFSSGLVWVVVCCASLARAELSPDTLQAWNEYVQAAETRARAIAAQGALMPDEEPDLREQLRNGRIPAVNAAPDSSRRLPHATLQDWAGAVFIPGVTVADVFSVVRDYDHYAGYYGPMIRSSQLLERADGAQKFRLRYVRKALFAVIAFDIDYESRDCSMADGHWYSMTRTTAVHQIKNFGEAGEHALAADDHNAFIWRARSFLHFDQSDGGVYIGQESVVLGHPIPAVWRWLVEPFVDRLARDLVMSWLSQTRDASIEAARAVRAGPSDVVAPLPRGSGKSPD